MALKFPLVASSLAPGEALAPSLILVLLTNRIELLGFVVIIVFRQVWQATPVPVSSPFPTLFRWRKKTRHRLIDQASSKIAVSSESRRMVRSKLPSVPPPRPAHRDRSSP